MDYNAYIWVPIGKKSYPLDDPTVQLTTQGEGVSYYSKDGDRFLWRFDRTTWREDNANLYSITHSLSPVEVKRAMNLLNGYTGAFLTKEQRVEAYKSVQMYTETELISYKQYQIMKSIQDKMKLLSEKANANLMTHALNAREQLPELVKSVDLHKALVEEGFKVFGNLEAYVVKSKTTDGEVDTKHILKTTFTSNGVDLDYEITSGEAIKSAVAKLSDSVIPIRFEHGKEDYGVWYSFNTTQKDGKVYGIAEGELDMSLNRSQDLWRQIYDYGKQFATSYGGRVIKSHIEQDKTTDTLVNIFDEVEFKEISLTSMPSNPDTAVEAINKYFTQIQDNLLVKTTDMDDTQTTETTEETVVTPTSAESTTEATEAPATEATPEATTPEAEAEAPAEAPAEEVAKADMSAIEAKLAEMSKTYDSLASRISALEGMMKKAVTEPAIQKSVVMPKDAEKTAPVATATAEKSVGHQLLDSFNQALTVANS